MADRAAPATDEGLVGSSATTGAIAAALAGSASLVSGVVVVSLVVFYAVEEPAPGPHVFGPISDIGTACWDLLAAPLFWGLGSVLFPRPSAGRALSAVAGVLSVAGAAGSTLLVAGVLPFGPSTAASVAVVLVQCAWLLVASRRWPTRRARRWDIAWLGRALALGQGVGAVLFAGSLAWGWGSPAQTVVMVTGLVPGAVGWACWPLWFALLSREFRSGRPLPVR